MPPIPTAVVTTAGKTIYTRADIEKGRQVWQSIGGQQLGSIWGHGSYVAPDWRPTGCIAKQSAWLDIGRARTRRSAVCAACARGASRFARRACRPRMRENTYDAATGNDHGVRRTAPLAMAKVAAHYDSLFGNDPATADLREGYAMRNDTVPDAEHRRALTAFFWWTAWAGASTRCATGGKRQSPIRTTGRASRSSATRRRRRCGCGRCSACCS